MSHQGLSGTPVGPHTTFLSPFQDSDTVGYHTGGAGTKVFNVFNELYSACEWDPRNLEPVHY